MIGTGKDAKLGISEAQHERKCVTRTQKGISGEETGMVKKKNIQLYAIPESHCSLHHSCSAAKWTPIPVMQDEKKACKIIANLII